MSVRCIDAVLNRSQHAGTELLMLIVLADYSDDDGNSYPSVASLARKCRMGQRNANYVLNSLQESGELRVLKNEGPRGTNRYRIMLAKLGGNPLQGAAPLQSDSTLQATAPLKGCAPLQPSSPTPATQFPKPLQPIADEPSLNRQEPERGRATRSPDSCQGTRLARDWVLPDDWKSYCANTRPDLDADTVAENFRDFWHGKAGKDGRKVDWRATWQRWVRNESSGTARAGTHSRARTVLHADHVFGADE